MQRKLLIAGFILLLGPSVAVNAQEPTVPKAVSTVPERLGVYVTSTNLERSRIFYETIFDAVPKVSTEYFIGFEVAGGLFAIVSKDQFAPNSTPGGNVVPYLRVPNAQTAYQHLKTVAPDTVAGSNLIHEGSLSLFKFVDPDGNVIEYFSLNSPIDGL